MTTTTTRSWRNEIIKADEDFQKDSLRPDAYEFSNGRVFKAPYPLYGTATGTE